MPWRRTAYNYGIAPGKRITTIRESTSIADDTRRGHIGPTGQHNSNNSTFIVCFCLYSALPDHFSNVTYVMLDI